MLNKKFILLAIFLVSLFAISSVSAVDNITVDPGSNYEIYYENEFESVGAFGLIPGEESFDKITELICKLLENIKY